MSIYYIAFLSKVWLNIAVKKPGLKTSKKSPLAQNGLSLRHLPKVLIILGPTASGKSALAIQIAKKFNGEVISADSRQVYKGLDIGTGKVTQEEMQGIPHHLLDIISPAKRYSVETFKHDAEKAIDLVLKKGKLPIIAGGTGFYIEALVKNIARPNVLMNTKLRKELASLSTAELKNRLEKIDPSYAKKIDVNNPVRLIRAIEIAEQLGHVPELVSMPAKYEFLQIGISTDDENLREKIIKRLDMRLQNGMVDEVRKLRAPKTGKPLSWKRLFELGLEYRYISLFLQGKLTVQEMRDELAQEIWQYARRQKTWFRRDKSIVWIENGQMKAAEKIVKEFLKKSSS